MNSDYIHSSETVYLCIIRYNKSLQKEWSSETYFTKKTDRKS